MPATAYAERVDNETFQVVVDGDSGPFHHRIELTENEAQDLAAALELALVGPLVCTIPGCTHYALPGDERQHCTEHGHHLIDEDDEAGR